MSDQVGSLWLKITVDLVTFYDDLKRAIKIFFKDLNSGKGDLQKNFEKGFARNPPFEIFKNVDLLDPNQPATGTPTISVISYKKVNFRRKRMGWFFGERGKAYKKIK